MSNKITIGFRFTNEFDEDFSADSTVNVYEEIGDMELDTIMEAFNQFLRQIGYHRPNDYIYPRDLTEDEYDAVDQLVSEMRDKGESNA